MKNRKLQIGVMGSGADLKYSKTVEKLAEEVGYWIAKNDAILVFGAEKDYDSLSSAACRGAKKAGGLTVGITYGKGKKIVQDSDVIVSTGMERGGGREFVLVLSCDAIIAIGGGSGTLTEMVIAYQDNIPIVALENTGGWSEKMSGEYFDIRKRIRVVGAKDANSAVKQALELAKSNKKF